EASIAGTRALLAATRRAILDGLPGVRRLQVLEALLAVEVRDADLAAAPVRPARSGGLAAARRRAERRADTRRRGERSRQKVESAGVALDAAVAGHLGRLPRPWLAAVCRNVGLARIVSVPAAARCFADRRTLARVVAELRPGERDALAALLDADGI